MIREHLMIDQTVDQDGFRLRGSGVSRLEALSDAVFGFAVTLLVVALEVPKTYADLLDMLRGFVAFAVCFVVLIMIWHLHFVFFRRYGLTDRVTVVLNAALLFVVLLYIYPLKFLFTLLIDTIVWRRFGSWDAAELRWEDAPSLMAVYSLSIFTVFLVFTLMFLHAHRKRRALDLSPVEVALTRGSIVYCGVWMGIALLSITIALTTGPQWTAIAGMSYVLLGPVQWYFGTRLGKAVDRAKRMV
jgi:uncharacterized membrane protein